MVEILNNLSLSVTEYIVIGLLVFTCLTILYGYFRFFLKIRSADVDAANQLPGITVVVTSCNAARYLERFLPSVLEQDYPDYEVVVVDKYSYDDTERVLGHMKAKYERLKLTFVTEQTSFPDKMAYVLGAKAATKEWLIFIDGQTKVPGKNWLWDMARGMQEGKDVVFGYGNVKYNRGFWNHLLRLQYSMRAMLCLSFSLNGLGCVYDTRNVALRKEAFFNSGVFSGMLNRKYADNELILQGVLKKNNYSVICTKNSIVSYDQYVDRREWQETIEKHLLLLRDYDLKQVIMMFLDGFLKVAFVGVFLVALLIPKLWLLAIIMFSVKLLSQIITYKLVQRHLGDKKILLSSLVCEVLFPVIYCGERVFIKLKRNNLS
ncbi:glycosyltransferase [Puteibacter caeruleilacunae]|nr:glycosyltransferase [Puteibacter caeruleilacunae]